MTEIDLSTFVEQNNFIEQLIKKLANVMVCKLVQIVHALQV
jgi:hypothetical protein